MTRSSRLAEALSCALLACASGIQGSSPHPTEVTPDAGYQLKETDIRIQGDGFLVEAYQDADGAPRIDASFRAWLDATELEDVTWVSENELQARVPAGLPTGKHRLEIRDPRGASGFLDDAFTVVPGGPDDEVMKVLDDPFADGTTFSFVFAYDGQVFLGPSGDGRGLVRCLPDGTGCASFALSFYPDRVATGSVLQNPCDRYDTLGSTTPPGSPGYCDPDNPWSTACNCGPNLEAGRGVLTSVTIAGNVWLVAMGRSKKHFLRYLYMTQDAATPLGMSYVDLTASIPVSPDPGVEDVTSLAVLNDRIYAGLQVDSADRPRMVVLTRTPLAPGLDAGTSDTVATTFQRTAMSERGIGISQVDAMLGFEGRLFVANHAAVLVSRTGMPDLSAADASTQFDECTPLAPATWLAGASGYVGKIDVTPADKVVSGLAAWRGRLYLARNTLANVPEIWVFTPRHDASGSFLGCAADRSDWQRIATNFAEPANVRATALFASSAFLYVGYDNATTGLQMFRTSSPAPGSEADFTGSLGCTAPCTPVGSAGFGDPTNARFFDARTMTFDGVDDVWATVGAGSGPVRVYRVSN